MSAGLLAQERRVANAIAKLRASLGKKRSSELDLYAGSARDVVDPLGTRAAE